MSNRHGRRHNLLIMRRPKKFKIKKSKLDSQVPPPTLKRGRYTKKVAKKDIQGYHVYFTSVRLKVLLLEEVFNKKFLPQISRLFTARALKLVFFTVAFAFFSGFLLINILFSSSPYQNSINLVEANFSDPHSHFLLAREFLKNNDLVRARQELLVGLMVSPGNSNLLEQLKLVEALIYKPGNIISEISKWRAIVLDKPDYRDGYFRLAVSYYQIFDEEMAKRNVLKALELDPNFEPAKLLLALLSK